MATAPPNGRSRPPSPDSNPPASARGVEMTTPDVTVCQVLHSLNVGGAEVLAARLARKLRDVHRFLFVCLDGLGPLGEKLRDEGFPVWVIDRRPGIDWRCARRLADLLRRERVDLVHAHQ